MPENKETGRVTPPFFMSQADFLQRIDEKLSRGIARLGAQDDALYYSADGALSAMPCKVLVDRDLLSLARLGIEIIEDSVLLRIQRAFLENRPKRGDAFVIGCEEFTVEKLVDQDESVWTCLCRA